MTDRFVPDKPGLYWYRNPLVEDGMDIAAVWEAWPYRLGAMRFPDAEKYEMDCLDWIAPVTPLDVVDGLVAALESVLNQDVDRYEKACAALQRYREG